MRQIFYTENSRTELMLLIVITVLTCLYLNAVLGFIFPTITKLSVLQRSRSTYSDYLSKAEDVLGPNSTTEMRVRVAWHMFEEQQKQQLQSELQLQQKQSEFQLQQKQSELQLQLQLQLQQSNFTLCSTESYYLKKLSLYSQRYYSISSKYLVVFLPFFLNRIKKVNSYISVSFYLHQGLRWRYCSGEYMINGIINNRWYFLLSIIRFSTISLGQKEKKNFRPCPW